MNSKAFICYANEYTEAECLEKLIFGFRSIIHFMGDTERIQTYGFLFNYKTDELIGPFIATTQMNISIDPNAFQGKCPYQVRVREVEISIRKKDALKFMNTIGIQSYRTQTGRILPSHQITLKKAEKVIQWLNNENFTYESLTNTATDIFGEFINSFAHESSKKASLEIRKLVSNKKRLPYEIADKLLIRLREEIIKPETPSYDDKTGLLRKSVKNIFLDKKISSHQKFEEICRLRFIEFDQTQSVFLPLIFEIIKKM